MKRLCSFFAFLLFVTAIGRSRQAQTAAGFRMEEILDPEGEVWRMTPEAFMDRYRQFGFSWMSSAKKTAKAYRKPITFLNMPVWEATVQFEENGSSELALILYNRGDAGELSKRQFGQQVASIQEKINQWTGARSRKLDDRLKTSGVKRKAQAWKYGPHQVRLVWSYSTRDKAGSFTYCSEFIRVEFGPSLMAAQEARERIMHRSSSYNKTVSTSELKSHVKRKRNGDVYIEGIPMVNQGKKGYCVVATAERVMRHFNFDVDQHEMAQLAASSAAGGTDLKVMMKVLKRVGVKLGCRVNASEEFDVADFVRLVERYNQLAHKKKQPKIQLERLFVVSEVYQQMDADILREARLKSRVDFRRFQKNIGLYIDGGNPLAWSVVLGKVEESPPVQGIGAHMRLIIGYNEKKPDVIYSDSWGPGHEFKRMSLDDAWMITTGLYAIEPRWKTP